VHKIHLKFYPVASVVHPRRQLFSPTVIQCLFSCSNMNNICSSKPQWRASAITYLHFKEQLSQCQLHCARTLMHIHWSHTIPVSQALVRNADFRLSGLYVSIFSIPAFYKSVKTVIHISVHRQTKQNILPSFDHCPSEPKVKSTGN